MFSSFFVQQKKLLRYHRTSISLSTRGPKTNHIQLCLIQLCLNVAGGWWSVVKRSSTHDQRVHFYKETGRIIDHLIENDVTITSEADKAILRKSYRLANEHVEKLCSTYEQLCSNSGMKCQKMAIFLLCLLKLIFRILCVTTKF